MLIFKKGEYLGGELLDVIQIESIDCEETWWNYPILEDCFILCVNKNKIETTFFNVNQLGIKYIPRKEDIEDAFWGLFWDSEVTLVFDFKESGIDCINNYVGHCVSEIRTLGKQIASMSSYHIKCSQFHKLSIPIGLNEIYPNEKLYYEFMNLIDSSNEWNIETFISTLKQFGDDLDIIF